MVNLKTHWSTCRSDSCCAALPGYMVWRSQSARRRHKSIIKIKKALHGIRRARENDTQDETTG